MFSVKKGLLIHFDLLFGDRLNTKLLKKYSSYLITFNLFNSLVVFSPLLLRQL